MTVERFDAVEEAILDPVKQGVIGALAGLHGNFSSAVKPEDGVFGFKEVIKDNGQVTRTWKTDQGTTVREYLQGGKLLQTKEAFPNRTVLTTKYDDNGTAYFTSKATAGKQVVADRVNTLTANTAIVKGNVTTLTDAYGRPVSASVKNLVLKEGARESLGSISRDGSFRLLDDKGHLIPDSFGSAASPENIRPQLSIVNRGLVKQVENIARQLKKDGATVDYEVKVNYSGKSQRPSSFEIKITADGKPVALPKELVKIYNTENPSGWTKFTTTVGEKFGLAHDAGIQSGLTAATLTAAVSTVNNVSKVISGEIAPQEAFLDVAKDTGIAGALGYGTTFVSTTVATAMKASSHTLLKSMGSLGIPSAVISFGVASFDSVVDFAKGDIDGKQLALALGESAASVGGGMVGGALLTAGVAAAVGVTVSALPAAAGIAAGLVGGMVGCALASEAYATAVEVVPEIADALKEKAQAAANGVADLVSNTIPEKLEDVKSAVNHFAAENDLPIRL
ncbi:MAG: DNA/RNA non-specific endonuclease [Oscillospiraceae bacterium]|jgi:hypothetical protein|nr:DNA/RNA non-specific endonuclease [Oscillospiraceae bacterium]